VRSALAVLALAWIVVAVVRGVTADGATLPDEPSAERVQQVRQLLNVVDQAEQCYFERHKRFSDNPAELTKSARDASEEVIDVTNPMVLASGHRLHLELWVSDDGQAYTQRIVGEDGIDSVYERDMTNDFADYGEYAWGHVKDTCAK
jgi:hypothetical protein